MKTDKLKWILHTLLPSNIQMYYTWKDGGQIINKDGWLEVCHRIEHTLNNEEREKYVAELFNISAEQYTEIFANWEEKAKAICKVKGIKYD